MLMSVRLGGDEESTVMFRVSLWFLVQNSAGSTYGSMGGCLDLSLFP